MPYQQSLEPHITMGVFGWNNESSLSNTEQRSPSRNSPLSTDSFMDLDATPEYAPPIFSLPPEIIQQILSYLSAQHLISLCRTCHKLKSHAEREQLWISLLKHNVPSSDFPSTPHPAPSYRELYLSHHPRWHLPRHRLWFSDDAYNGKLILVKFDPRRGCIEGYRLTAEKPPGTVQAWSYKPNVIIHLVDPRVYASIEDPVISLPLSIPHPNDPNATSFFSRRMSSNNDPSSSSPLLSDVRMRIGHPTHQISAALMPSKDLPESTASTMSVAVWPPRTVPDMPRTRSSSSSGSFDKFTSRGHRPQTLDELSRTTFRLRTWSHFTQGMLQLGVRIGEEVSTWSTLAPALYAPTPSKPYQGLFVGDYASHGCEFLLVLHTEQAPRYRRPEEGVVAGENNRGNNDEAGARRRGYISAVLAALRESQFLNEDDDPARPSEANADPKNSQGVAQHQMGRDVTPNVEDPDGLIHRGALEAIKITGDVNVPRGEHTFIADDIGPTGTLRIAHEAPFRGARVVRSRGHVAARGFRDDEFIPSQLFLISPDLLAQYWLPFGHISFYKRVDIDELSSGAVWTRRASE